MNVLILTSPGLDTLAAQEIAEQGGQSKEHNIFVIEPENVIHYIKHAQAPRRIILILATATKINELQLETIIWKNYLLATGTIKLVIENIKGQDNRSELSRKLIPLLLPTLESAGIKATLDMKKPNSTLILAKQEENYIFGLDLCGEINSRAYRVFPHAASLKGDLAYFLARKAKIEPGKRFLVGFAKDGAIGIEAALYTNHIPLRDANIKKIPILENIKEKTTAPVSKTTIDLFEPILPAINAIRKNAYIAHVKDYLTATKCNLDELDVKFTEHSFDSLLFHLTSKDEDKINELYYQADYILKSGGLLLFFAREDWQPSISSKFKMVSSEKIARGENVSIITTLEKK